MNGGRENSDKGDGGNDGGSKDSEEMTLSLKAEATTTVVYWVTVATAKVVRA